MSKGAVLIEKICQPTELDWDPVAWRLKDSQADNELLDYERQTRDPESPLRCLSVFEDLKSPTQHPI